MDKVAQYRKYVQALLSQYAKDDISEKFDRSKSCGGVSENGRTKGGYCLKLTASLQASIHGVWCSLKGSNIRL